MPHAQSHAPTPLPPPPTQHVSLLAPQQALPSKDPKEATREWWSKERDAYRCSSPHELLQHWAANKWAVAGKAVSCGVCCAALVVASVGSVALAGRLGRAVGGRAGGQADGQGWVSAGQAGPGRWARGGAVGRKQASPAVEVCAQYSHRTSPQPTAQTLNRHGRTPTPGRAVHAAQRVHRPRRLQLGPAAAGRQAGALGGQRECVWGGVGFRGWGWGR